ncbi:hypothetical protein Tco_0256010 [Tanacetum coccineum]
MKDMNTSLWNWNSTNGFYQYCPKASIVSYSLVICASAWYLNNGSIEYHENNFLIIYSLVSYSLVICASVTYPPLDDCQLWETLGSTISVSMKDMNTSPWNWNSTYGFYQYCPMASIVSYSLVICASATYPPLDDCQLWETLGSTISVSMKDMNTSLWNWNSTYGFYQYCPMASIVSYSLVICASAWYLNNGSIEYHENSFLIIYSLDTVNERVHMTNTLGAYFVATYYFTVTSSVADWAEIRMVTRKWPNGQVSWFSMSPCIAWYLNNGSIEYHENSFLIIYSLGKFFKRAHSFGLASCCTPCVSNVSSLTYPPLDDCQLWETLGSTISVSMKDMNTSLWNWNSTYGFYQYCPMASIVSYSLVICASATYPPLDDCQLWETLGSTISVSMKDMNTSLWNWNSTYGFYQYCPMASIVSYSLVICASAWYLNNGSIEYHENSFLIIYSLVSYSLVICASAWYLNNGSIEYHENSFLIIYSLGKFFKGAHSFGLASCCTPCVSNVSSLWSVLTYPLLDDCQLWETLGSTISVSMKDMNTSLWNWNSTYGFYQYCPMASIVSYSLVICASAWYLNNGSIEYHENNFLIIYSLGKFFKGAHSFSLAFCCTPCVSNVSSLWSVLLS